MLYTNINLTKYVIFTAYIGVAMGIRIKSHEDKIPCRKKSHVGKNPMRTKSQRTKSHQENIPRGHILFCSLKYVATLGISTCNNN